MKEAVKRKVRPDAPRIHLSLGVMALVLFGLVGQCLAQPPTQEKRLPPKPVPIATPKRALLNAPAGPCSGSAHFIVGPGLGRTETTSTTISWALDRAAARNVCSVEIEVQPGIYPDPLTITRDTTITNSPPAERPVVTGSITSYGHVLTMTSIILRDTPTPGALVLIGGGHSVLEGGLTVLQDVTIERAAERGIALKGGVLKITSSEIRGTKASASRQGVAIDVSFAGSASRAFLDSVLLEDNVGWGIDAAGSGTVVRVREVTVRGTTRVLHTGALNRLPSGADRISRERRTMILPRPGSRLPAPRASVVVRDVGAIRIGYGASLYGKTLNIDQNEWAGLLIDQGGQANLQDSTFTATRSIGDDPANVGGNNIIVRAGGSLELLTFTSTDGDLSGLIINGGWVKGTNGTLTRNEFGLAIVSAANGWKRTDCFSNTRAFDNRSSDLSDDLVVPSYSDSNSHPQPCHGVPVPLIYTQ